MRSRNGLTYKRPGCVGIANTAAAYVALIFKTLNVDPPCDWPNIRTKKKKNGRYEIGELTRPKQENMDTTTSAIADIWDRKFQKINTSTRDSSMLVAGAASEFYDEVKDALRDAAAAPETESRAVTPSANTTWGF